MTKSYNDALSALILAIPIVEAANLLYGAEDRETVALRAWWEAQPLAV